MTFAELKARLDTLTPEQLAMPVRWWGDERGGVVDSLDTLGEVWVSVGEGMEPISSYEGDADVIEGAANGDLPTLPAGTPILMVDP